MSAEPELILAPAAERVLRGLVSADRERLAEVLTRAFREEAEAKSVALNDPDFRKYGQYLAMPSGGYTVVYRPMTPDELSRQGRKATKGYFIIDILPQDSLHV